MDELVELLYLYIEKSNFGINQESINFSSNYKVEFNKKKESKLTIVKKENIYPFFEKNVTNINLVVGKNGVGKSSIMKLISFDSDNRREFLKGTSYFILYKIKENLFFIEGTNALLKQILGERIGSNKINCYFEFIDNRPQEVKMANSKEIFLESSYQATIPNLEWVESPSIKKVNKYYPIDKELYPTVDFLDLLEFISQSTINKVENVEITFKHKKSYSNNTLILFSLYELTVNDLDLINKENSNSNLSFETLFSNEVNNTLRNIYREKYDSREGMYNQTYQNKVYGKKNLKSKDPFILSFLEKEVINMLRNLKIDGFNKVLNVFNKIIKIRNNNVLLNEKNNINEKNSFLLSVIYDLDNSYIKSRKFEEIKKIIFFLENDLELMNVLSNNILVFKLQEISGFNQCKEIITKYHMYFDPKIRQLSDGQLVYFNTYSKIYHKLISEEKRYPLLLLLDEPDMNLHPEWSRNFINELVELINNDNIIRKVQVIISTHSPFMVTDLPSDKVYRITEKGNISNVELSFAANIHDLLLDSFFLDSSIGEFAKIKLKETQKSDVISKIDDPFLKILFEDGKLI